MCKRKSNFFLLFILMLLTGCGEAGQPSPSRLSTLPQKTATSTEEIIPLPSVTLTKASTFTPAPTAVPVLSFDNAQSLQRYMVLEDESQDEILDIAFSLDSSLLVSAEVYDPESGVSVWDLSTGELKQRLLHHTDAVASVAFSPDGALLATGSLDGSIAMWDAVTWLPMFDLKEHNGQVRTLVFSPDGELLASGGTDNRIVIWNVAEQTVRHTFQQGVSGVERVAFSPDGHFLAVATGETVLRIWDVDEGSLVETLSSRGNIHEIAYSNDGRLMAIGSLTWSSDESYDPLVPIVILDLESGEEHSVGAQPEAAFRLAFSLDDTVLFSVSSQNKVRIWDVASGELIEELSQHAGRLRAMTISPDGRSLAVGSQTGHIFLYGLHEIQTVGTYEFLGFGCIEENLMILGFRVPSGISEGLSAQVGEVSYTCNTYEMFPNRAYCHGPRIPANVVAHVQLFTQESEVPVLEEDVSSISCEMEQTRGAGQADSAWEPVWDCSLMSVCISCGNSWIIYPNPDKEKTVCECYLLNEETALCAICALNPDAPQCSALD